MESPDNKCPTEQDTEFGRTETSDIAKAQFITNMSHDIRTPLNSITGFISLALGCLDDKQQVREYLIKAAISSQRLLDLIDDILEMSSIEAGRIKLDEAACSINEIISDLNSTFTSQIRSKQQQLLIETDLTDDAVICDRLRLNQILSNLLSNAIKYTPIGGNITINVKQTKSEKGSGRYEFHIKDTGVGMNKEFLSHIFEAFERDRSATITQSQGTGLGLAITKRITDLMGGIIEVQSEPGKGTEFVVVLYFELADKPLLDSSAASVANEDLSDLNFDGKHILLVEDNDLNSEIAQTILENYGFIVTSVENGAQAVEKFKASPNTYDLILMDIQMPVMNGYEATKAIRTYEQDIGGHVPVIALTANIFDDDRKTSFSAGMDDHLPKPIDIPTTIRTIRKYIR